MCRNISRLAVCYSVNSMFVGIISWVLHSDVSQTYWFLFSCPSGNHVGKMLRHCLFCKSATVRRFFLVQEATLDMSHHPVVFILIVQVLRAIVFYSFMRKSPLTDKSAVVEASAVVCKLGHNKTSSSSKDTRWPCHTPTGFELLNVDI